MIGIFLVILSTSCIQETPLETTKEAVLLAYREAQSETHGATHASREGGKLSIELDDGDGLFTYYESPVTASESEVWDLVFIDMYFLSDPQSPDSMLKKFKQQHQKLAKSVMKKYALMCPVARGSAELCISNNLTQKNHVRSGGGRYDEGYRCMVWKDKPFDTEKDCKPY